MPTWWCFGTPEGAHWLFSLLCHLTEPGCQLSGEALQGFERYFPLLHGPAHQITTTREYKVHDTLTDKRICFLLMSYTMTVGLQNMVIYAFLSFSTCEHCCNTSSLNLRNPSWILGWFKGNDRKCVNGCFFRKLSTRTSTRVTADDTADLWGAVITVSHRKKVRRMQWV